MEGVEFEEQQHPILAKRKIPLFLRLVIKYSRGKIRTELQANLVLLCFAGIFFLMAIFIGASENAPEYAVPENIIQKDIEQMQGLNR